MIIIVVLVIVLKMLIDIIEDFDIVQFPQFHTVDLIMSGIDDS